MIEVNLIPDVKRELLRAQVQRNFVTSIAIIGAAGFAAFVILAAMYVYGAQTLIMKSANDSIDREYATLSSVEDLDKMLTIQNQLQTVSALNQNKLVSSRLYEMLNIIVPENPHRVGISSVTVTPQAEEGGALISVEGQTTGGYASLEVFEKTIAAAVIEYKSTEDSVETVGEMKCGDDEYACRYLTVGGGDRSTAVQVSDMNFGEDQSGRRTLFFNLSFTVVPELLSNKAANVRLKIGQDGNVTDSYRGIPRAIFEDRPVADGEDE